MNSKLHTTLSWLTGALMALLVVYGATWYQGVHEGNFSVLLLCIVCVTGLYWLAERFYFLPQRQKAAVALEEQELSRRAQLARQGITQVDSQLAANQMAVLQQPWWLDWTAGIFPVITVVFLLRSFVFEPFKIPSESMLPTLLVGDLIVVNKYHYGVRLPVAHTLLVEGSKVARGDVMVFRHPPNPKRDYIKRVIGLPGDEVSYMNKQLKINGQDMPLAAAPEFLDRRSNLYYPTFQEKLSEEPHQVLVGQGLPVISPFPEFPFKDNCRYSIEGVVCKVPQGHYFMMGDNRDNSEDSRYWGFVPDSHIVGKATRVWMNFSDLGRIGTKIR